MERLIQSDDAQKLDAATRTTLGIDDVLLMEKASVRLWDALKAIMLGFVGERSDLRSIEELHVLAVCGKGNNGGDALAVLRHAWSFGLHNIEAFVSSGNPSIPCAKQREMLTHAGVGIQIWRDWRQLPQPLSGETQWSKAAQGADIILDGVLGSGIKGPPREETANMIVAINDLRESPHRPIVVSIDLPSGLWSGYKKGEPCVNADYTLSLSPTKLEYFIPDAREACGTIVSIDDVFPKSLVEKTLIEGHSSVTRLEAGDLAKLKPWVSRSAYKMSRGKVAIFAGSKGRLGAALECASSALASGAGYVTLFVEEELYNATATALPSVIVRPEEDFFSSEKQSDSVPYDAVLVGPGWGLSEARREQLRFVLSRAQVPVVLDADALRLLHSVEDNLDNRKFPLVLTPHPGEFRALQGEESQVELSDDFKTRLLGTAVRYNAYIVYKSHVTWIASPKGRIAVWDGMNPALGTAGSGDVLSGLLAGILAMYESMYGSRCKSDDACSAAIQDKVAFNAACAAVISHGVAGANLADRSGWFSAPDLIPECARLLGKADI